MQFKGFMDFTFEHDGKTHQMDPLFMVPSGLDDGLLVPLYERIGMEQSAAKSISRQWRLSELRRERDRLISETDWWVLADRNPTAEQLAYRQALRDITQNFDPEVEVQFPAKPE